MVTEDALKTICPSCEVVRWHDRDGRDGTATCRSCGYESRRDERHEVRIEMRLDDLEPDLKDNTETGDSQTDLSGWST